MSRVCQRGHEIAMSVLNSALKPPVASQFAPPLLGPPNAAAVASLEQLIRAAGSRTVIVTGAGVSTERCRDGAWCFSCAVSPTRAARLETLQGAAGGPNARLTKDLL